MFARTTLRTLITLAGAAATALYLFSAPATAHASFSRCPDRPNELLWDIQVHDASCAAAAKSWSLDATVKDVNVATSLYKYTSTTGWSCLEKRYHGPAQDNEVQLWDCRRGSAEALLSDTPSVASRPL